MKSKFWINKIHQQKLSASLALEKFSISSHCLNPPNDDDDGHRVWLRNWLICWLSVQGGATWWAQHTLFNQMTVRLLVIYLIHIQIYRCISDISYNKIYPFKISRSSINLSSVRSGAAGWVQHVHSSTRWQVWSNILSTQQSFYIWNLNI